jgi:hypothetical protein
VNETNQIAYQYIGFTFNKIIGGVGIASLSFSEIQIFGREKIKKFTDERQYPPKLFDTFTAEVLSTGELFNISPTSYYKEVISLNATEITFGFGNYQIYSSSILNSTLNTFGKRLLFNYILTDPVGAAGSGIFTAPLGTYAGNNFIKSDYLGDWILIKIPNPIFLTKIKFYAKINSIYRAPSLWKCYGSKDGITFIEIIEASNDTTALMLTDYPSNVYEKKLSTFKIEYSYIGFTFNKLVGDNIQSTILNFSEIQIFGKEEKIYNNNIVIKTLNVYDDGYCSQNREAILYMGNDFRIKKPTYHKLISKNLNSISLAMTDDFEKPTNGISSDIDIGLIIHVKDYKNQQDNNL